MQGSRRYQLKISLLEVEFNSLLRKEDNISTLFGITDEKYATTIYGKQKIIEIRGEEITSWVLVKVIHDM